MNDPQLTPPGNGAPSSVRKPATRFVPPDHSNAENEGGQGSGIEKLLNNTQGYIVGRLGNKMLRLDTDGHILTIAPTRSGKGTSCIIPNLLDHPGSAFVIDIRGDTLARTADARLLMGQDVVVLDPYQVSGGRWGYDSFNPLDILKPGEVGFEQHIRRTSDAIMFDGEGRGSKEPLWDNATRLALNGALTYIKTCLPVEMQNLSELSRLFSLKAKKRQEIAEEITLASMSAPEQYSKALDTFVDFFTTGSEKTKVPDNTVVQLMTLLEWVGHREFKETLGRSTFSFETMQTKPTTVYLVLPEEYIKGCEVWVRLLFSAALFQLKEVNALFKKTSNKLDQEQRVLFLLDEFPAFGKLQPVEDGMATVAGRGATLWLFVQHISQLDKIYNEHSAKQIVGNASLIQAFNSNEIHEQEYFSRVVGEEMFDVESVTVGTNVSTGGGKGTSHTVTVGNSESLTKSTNYSITKAETLTITESETEGKTNTKNQSTATGLTDGVGDTLTDTHGTNKNSGETDSINSGGNEGVSGKHYLLDYFIDIPLHQQKNSGSNWGKGFSRQRSRGISDSLSKARSRNRSKSVTDTSGTAEADSFSKSRSEARSESRSETTGGGESKTAGTSKSDATGTSENENWSRGENFSYTVKPEQRKIETPRSLRRSMSHGSQLLVMRGYYAFIAPRLNYYERGPDPILEAALNRPVLVHRFPEMAFLAGEVALADIWNGYVREHFEASVRGAESLGLPVPWQDDFGKEAFTQFLDEVRRDHFDSVASLKVYGSSSNGESGWSSSRSFHEPQEVAKSRAVKKVLGHLEKLRTASDDMRLQAEKDRVGQVQVSAVILNFFDFLMGFIPEDAPAFLAPFNRLLENPAYPDPNSTPAIELTKSLLLFEKEELAKLLADDAEDLRLDNTGWLFTQYQDPLFNFVDALNKVIADREEISSLQKTIAASMEETIRQVEEAIDNSLEEAVFRQIARRG